MRRLVVALLVLVAGCSAADSPSDEPTPTLSPVSVPGDPAAALVSHDGVTSACELLAAHERQLAAATGTQVVSGGMFTRGPDYDYVLTVTRNGSRYRATLRDDTQWPVNGSLVVDRTTTDLYHAGDRVLVRTSRAGTVRYHVQSGDGRPPFETVRARQLEALLTAADLEVGTGWTDRGDYHLSAEGLVVDRLPTFRGVVTNTSVPGFYATVTPDGYLTQYRFSYSGTLDGEPVHGWFRLGPSAGPAVEEPDWYATAVNATR